MLLNVLRNFSEAALRAARNKLNSLFACNTIKTTVSHGPKEDVGPPHPELEQLLALFNAGEHAELEKRASMLLDEYPNSGFIWKILGASQEVQGKDSLPAMYQSVSLSKGDAQAYVNLGVALQKRHLLTDAASMFRKALDIDSSMANIHDSLGLALLGLGRSDEAACSFRCALEIAPLSANTHNNLGLSLRDQGLLDEALVSFQRALEIDPDNTNSCNSLGSALRDIGLFDKAEGMFKRALEINPNNLDAQNNLGFTLYQKGKAGDAISVFRKALEFDSLREDVHSNLLYVLSTQTDYSAADKLSEAKRFGKLVARKATRFGYWENATDPDRCLRIGLVSADLRNHPVGHFIEGVLKAMANSYSKKIEVFAYSNSIYFDEVAERIKLSCKNWHMVVGVSDQDLAGAIHKDCIDILIDLSGHTSGNRLSMFAWKPSPVQVSWLGYWSTTGVQEIDYIIADPWTLQESEAHQFTEKIWRLPETRLCFTPPEMPLSVNPLPAIVNGYVTFGCFNRLEKITDEVIALWSRILIALPGSCLMLKARQLNEPGMQRWVIERFRSHGLANDRIILEGHSSRSEYLAAYQKIDIALDPFPFTGGTTSVEALWMGVPVLTLAGKSFLSRQGVGLLMNGNLSQWIAGDTCDYFARAVSYATDLQALASLRQHLRQQVLVSPIFDTKSFAGHLEMAFRGMWRTWCSNQW